MGGWGWTVRGGAAGARVAGYGAAIGERCRARLTALGVEREVLACDPAFADTAAFCAKYGVAPQQSANTLVVAARKEPGVACACVVLATCRLDVNHAVCDLRAVRKASFATAERTSEGPGKRSGGVRPGGGGGPYCGVVRDGNGGLQARPRESGCR